MLVLTETTDNIQIVLGGSVTTNQLRCFSSYRDITTTTYNAGRNATNTNNTTDVNLVASPSASTQRVVDTISVYNSDTENAVVTIKFDANGTEYVIFSCTLGQGERLEYADGSGWKVFTNAGSIKTSVNQGNNAVSSSLSSVVLGSNVTNNNAVANTIQDVTGLSFPVINGGVYYFKFTIWYTAAATATGSRWTINGSGGATASNISYYSNYSLTTTSITQNQGVTAFDSPATSNATSAATAGNTAIIEGYLTATNNGSIIARFASEVAGSAIVARAGSTVYYQQVL